MKRLFTIALALSSLSLFAQEQPAYLKDAEITVKLTNGKEYKYSANEYAVVKRNAKPAYNGTVPIIGYVEKEEAKELIQHHVIITKEEAKKNIVSVEVSSSQKGFDVSQDSSKVNVETKRKAAAGVMYQRNFYKDLYLGGRADTNGGMGLNLGLGF